MEQERRERREREAHEGYLEEAGRKGGSAAMAAGTPYARETSTATYALRDLVRWGPIWGGLLIALGIQIVLSAIGLAVSLGAYDPASPNYAAQVANTLAIWTAISALIALFVGGFIAGRMGAVLGLENGMVQGSVVWALALVFSVLLSGIGVAGFLGNVLNINQLMAGVGLTAQEAQIMAQNTISGTWWFVVGAILAWAAAVGGAILGTSRHEAELEHRP